MISCSSGAYFVYRQEVLDLRAASPGSGRFESVLGCSIFKRIAVPARRCAHFKGSGHRFRRFWHIMEMGATVLT